MADIKEWPSVNERILIWAGPNQNWDLGRPSSKLVQPRSELGFGPAQIRIGIWAGPI